MTRRMGGRAAPALMIILCLLFSGCGTPVSVERVDAHTVQRDLTSNALTTALLSGPTQITLRRLDLLNAYSDDPAAAIRTLTGIVAAGRGDPNRLFALAEMAFLHAERTNDRAYFLATVVYAYAFLFPNHPADRPDPFDPRLRTAADLYNRSLTRALTAPDGLTVELRSGEFLLPSGTLSVTFDGDAMRWAGRGLTSFISAAELRINGLRYRFREPGLGAPLAGQLAPVIDERGIQTAPAFKVPVTVLLKLDISPEAIASGRYQGTLVAYPGNEERKVEINGQSVPLEIEPSAALAYTLSNPTIWQSELSGFMRGDYFARSPTQLVALGPYRPGRIPVVLVHGTASSAGRWADMINDLQNDPMIRDRFQFWLFVYSTGNPITLSASTLRQELEAAIVKLDPERRDPALRNIVVIGHSQGGLLTKSLVVESGNTLYDRFSERPLDELKMAPETRETIRSALFLTPMPDVKRVIFIATPHRGSFIAGNSIVHWITELLTLPLSITQVIGESLMGNLDGLRFDPTKIRLGSVYGMTPGSPYIQGLSALPVVPSVSAHSIIAVDGDGPVEDGDDGVVAYRSAHIDEAVSEIVVRSGHSVQAHPQTLAEVRRILLLHWAEACPQGCAPPDPVAVAQAGAVVGKVPARTVRPPPRRLLPAAR